MNTKKCTKCGVEKDATSHNFYQYEKCKLTGKCKPCLAKQTKSYRSTEKGKASVKKSNAKFRKNNLEKVILANKKSMLKYGDKYKTKHKERLINDPEYKGKYASYNKEWRKSEKGKEWLMSKDVKENQRKRTKDYRDRNPQKCKESVKKYQYKLPVPIVVARIKAQTGLASEDITPEMIETKRLLTFIKREFKKPQNGESKK